MSNRRFEMYQYRQALARRRSRAGLVGARNASMPSVFSNTACAGARNDAHRCARRMNQS